MFTLIHELGRMEDGIETACNIGSLENRPIGRWVGVESKGQTQEESLRSM